MSPESKLLYGLGLEERTGSEKPHTFLYLSDLRNYWVHVEFCCSRETCSADNTHKGDKGAKTTKR